MIVVTKGPRGPIAPAFLYQKNLAHKINLSYFAGALRSKVMINLPKVDFGMWCTLYNPAD